MSRKPLSRQSNKKLTNKQKETVSDNLEKRIEKLYAANAIEATVISHMGYNIIVETEKNSPLIACDWKQNIGYICAGDRVLISMHDNYENSTDTVSTDFIIDDSKRQPDKSFKNATIEAVLPRKTVIEKQNVYRGAKPFASNIEQIIVIVTHEPMFQPSLLDRYLITANMVGIDCLIFFNKTDILTEAKMINHIQQYENIYQAIPNVNWVRGSVETGDGLDSLMQHLDHKKTVITGQSGVGKSSLINAIIPNLNIQTMSISKASGLGRHSTTNSTFYHLGENGVLIDTPGVRSFDTYHLQRSDIERGFVEIHKHLGYCKFSNCSHTQEKECSLLDAIRDGEISKLRYDSFMQISSEIKDS